MIYIGQYHGTSLDSKAIRFFTWSNISHTSAFLPGLQEVIEAWPRTGVIKRHWRDGHKPGTVIDVYRIPCTKEQADKFYAGMESTIGTPYDYRGIIGFIARGRLHNPNKLFCSEVAFGELVKVGIILLERVKPYQVSPGLLNTSTVLGKTPYKRLVV